jgi:hypothetical protein
MGYWRNKVNGGLLDCRRNEMKTSELFEAKASAKRLKLQEIFTRENFVQNYDVIMGYLEKMSLQNFEDLVARHDKVDTSPEDVDFQLNMILKALPKEIGAQISIEIFPKARHSKLESVNWETSPKNNLLFTKGAIYYFKGKWYIDARWYESNGWEITIVEKKIDNVEDVLDLILPGLKEVVGRMKRKKL